MVEAGKILRLFCHLDKQKIALTAINFVGSILKMLAVSTFFKIFECKQA
jgi:hypothetical protein